MPGRQGVWRSEAGGDVAADVGAFRLVVRSPGRTRGPVRFVVLRREGGEGRHALVGSGTEADLRTAMAKAARMADRLVGPPPGGLRRAV